MDSLLPIAGDRKQEFQHYLIDMPMPLFFILATVIAILFWGYLHILYPIAQLQPVFLGYFIAAAYGWFFGKKRATTGALCLFLALGFFTTYKEEYSSLLNKVLGLTILLSSSNIAAIVSRLYRELRHTKEELTREHRKNEILLENILPPSIAQRLKNGEKLIADSYEESSVLFFDLVGFTSLASQLPPERIVNLLNSIVCRFDSHVEKLKLEKIKTIGDAYMVVSGLPDKRIDHATAIADMALAMKESIEKINTEQNLALNMRIGIHSGPVVGGVIGHKKFTFDLWGDTVNIASRLEHHGVPGEIQVSEATYNFLKESYHLEPRGEVDLKNRGFHKTWILKEKRVSPTISIPSSHTGNG